MEELSLESEFLLCPFIFPLNSIGFITQDRMSYVGHMNTYLVGSSCLERYLDKREFFSFIMKYFFDTIVRYSISSFYRIFNSHLESIIWITTYHGFDSPCMIFWFSEYESEVGFLYFVIMDQSLEFSQSNIIFCNQ